MISVSFRQSESNSLTLSNNSFISTCFCIIEFSIRDLWFFRPSESNRRVNFVDGFHRAGKQAHKLKSERKNFKCSCSPSVKSLCLKLSLNLICLNMNSIVSCQNITFLRRQYFQIVFNFYL